jgi:hypothetical protein
MADIRMSGKFDNNLRGVLFKRIKEKETSSDYGGQCEIGGVEYWIDAWVNKSKDQRFFLSLRFKLKAPRTTCSDPPFNDEIPF